MGEREKGRRMIAKQTTVLATKGEPVEAETVGGRKIQVVEFFDPEALAEKDEDTTEADGITLDLPLATWVHMDEPTEITVVIIPGNRIDDPSVHRIEDYA